MQQTFCVFPVSKCFDCYLPEGINTRYKALFTINICFSAGQTRAAKFQHCFESNALQSSPMLLYKSSKTAESISLISLNASQACVHLANVENFISYLSLSSSSLLTDVNEMTVSLQLK